MHYVMTALNNDRVTFFAKYSELSLLKSQNLSVTYKVLVEISPSGAVIFSSQLYKSSISDKEIVQRRRFSKKEMWSKGDSVMADKRFLNSWWIGTLGVSLNISVFLGVTKGTLKVRQIIASVGIHAERAIQRIKTYCIIQNEIPFTLHWSIKSWQWIVN